MAELKYNLDIKPESIWLTVSPSAVAKDSLFYVQELGEFFAGPTYFTSRSGLASYLIKYTISGEGIVEYGGKTYTSTSGSAFWLDCKQPAYYYTSPRTREWRVVWIHYYGNGTGAYYELFQSLNNGNCLVNLRNHSDAAAAILFSLISQYRREPANVLADIQANASIVELLTTLLSAATQKDVRNVVPQYIKDARTYLREHFADPVTLDQLSERFNINKYYFLKVFKNYTGFTPNEYVIKTRINRAKELLRTTDSPVYEIAAEVGIHNPSHFINLFRKNEGYTPQAYRRAWSDSQSNNNGLSP